MIVKHFLTEVAHSLKCNDVSAWTGAEIRKRFVEADLIQSVLISGRTTSR